MDADRRGASAFDLPADIGLREVELSTIPGTAKSMQQTISPPAISASAIPLPAWEAQKVSTASVRALTIPVPIAIVWHETLSAVATQFGMLLPCVLAFALITSVMGFLSTLHVPGLNPHIGYAIGALLMAFIRGAIAWIGLQDVHGRPARALDLLHQVPRKWPALLVSSVIYGIVMTSGAARLDDVRQKLQSQLAQAVSAAHPVTVMAFITVVAQHDAVVKFVDVLIPRPGQPYEDWFAQQRAETTVPPICNDSGLLAHEINHSIAGNGQSDPCAGRSDPPAALTDVESILILFAGEILLCFCTVAAFRPAHTEQRNWGVIGIIAPFADSARVAVRRFGCVAVHIWLLRVCIATIGAVPFIVPQMLVHGGPSSIYSVTTARLPGAESLIAAFSTFSAVITTTFVALFCLLYEARLYARLTEDRVILRR